jgi:hypothetical protein
MRTQEMEVAQAELERCLRGLVSLFPDPDFQKHPPELVLDPGYPPLPEQPLLETDTDITLYTRSDLTRPPEEILTILLHKAIHAFHAFRWQGDCTAGSYHTQVFRRQAERMGFEVVRSRRYGWSRTLPTAPLRGLFEQIALAEDTLVPFQDSFRFFRFRRRHSWACGQRRFPDRAELATQFGRCCSDSRRLVRTLRVHRRESSPVVRLAGRWLVPFGFHEGTALKVEVSYGRLTIEARAFGEER